MVYDPQPITLEKKSLELCRLSFAYLIRSFQTVRIARRMFRSFRFPQPHLKRRAAIRGELTAFNRIGVSDCPHFHA